MKQAQNARKQRGRSAPRKGGRNNSGGGGNRTENRSRGNPKQLLEKYKNQAADALRAGDRVSAEYFFQFADHYQRVVNEMQPARDHQQNRDQQNDQDTKDNRQQRRPKNRSDQKVDAAKDNKTEGSGEKGAAGDSKDASAIAPARSEPSKPDVAVTPPVDLAGTDQPAEVRPELDLGSGDKAAAPKAPVKRRRSPKPKPADAAVTKEPIVAAPSTSESDPAR